MGLERLLLFLGFGFLVVNVRAMIAHLRYWRRRPAALLVWPASYPPFFTLQLVIGGMLGLLLSYNLLFRLTPPEELFGEGMMFIYYAYAVPMAQRLERGFYGDGVWTDGGYVAYDRIASVSWREEEEPVLLLATPDGRALRLVVPGEYYGEVRRLLRDLIEDGTVAVSHGGLNLGLRDDKDDA
jgi:hypothetical protein